MLSFNGTVGYVQKREGMCVQFSYEVELTNRELERMAGSDSST